MAKKIAGTLKLQIPAGKNDGSDDDIDDVVIAALGRHEINIEQFLNALGDSGLSAGPGSPLTVHITKYEDYSFDFDIVETGWGRGGVQREDETPIDASDATDQIEFTNLTGDDDWSWM